MIMGHNYLIKHARTAREKHIIGINNSKIYSFRRNKSRVRSLQNVGEIQKKSA